MKFLHAADIHLDSPLRGLHARSDLPDTIIRDFTRRAFSALVDLAHTENVAFVIIAGDLYDGDWKDFSTGLFFAKEMHRLNRPCFLLRGNHDARSLITKNLDLPPNVQEFSSRTCQTFQLPDLNVALHGHSFPNRAVPEDLSANYPHPTPGMLNIGVLHTSAEDPGEHETYAPCSVAALVLKGYDYWALGHIHARRILSERPWIVFPGNIQGRHPKETGTKGCTIVTIEDRAITNVEARTLDVLRWAALQIDVSNLDEFNLSERIAEEIRKTVAEAEGRPILARLTLTGQTALHGTLTADTEQLAAECQNTAIEAGGNLWIESVRIRTKPIAATSTGLLGPLHEVFAQGLDDPALIKTLLEDLAALRQKLPAPARLDTDIPANEADLRAMLEEAWQVTSHALIGAGE